MNAFVRLLVVFIVYLATIVLVSNLAYEQGFYNGLTVFCSEGDLLVDVSGNIICGGAYDGGDELVFGGVDFGLS